MVIWKLGVLSKWLCGSLGNSQNGDVDAWGIVKMVIWKLGEMYRNGEMDMGNGQTGDLV